MFSGIFRRGLGEMSAGQVSALFWGDVFLSFGVYIFFNGDVFTHVSGNLLE